MYSKCMNINIIIIPVVFTESAAFKQIKAVLAFFVFWWTFHSFIFVVILGFCLFFAVQTVCYKASVGTLMLFSAS